MLVSWSDCANVNNRRDSPVSSTVWKPKSTKKVRQASPSTQLGSSGPKQKKISTSANTNSNSFFLLLDAWTINTHLWSEDVPRTKEKVNPPPKLSESLVLWVIVAISANFMYTTECQCTFMDEEHEDKNLLPSKLSESLVLMIWN